MKNSGLLVGLILLIYSVESSADSIRRISGREGLTNNAVLSLHQDEDGFIWIGTCEGLNRWNGIQIEPFPLPGSASVHCSGNLIDKITRAGENSYWIRTNYGLDLMKENSICERHQEFFGLYYYFSTSPQQTVVLTQNGEMFGYNSFSHRFDQIARPDEIRYDNYLSAIAPNDNNLIWIITREGIISCRLTISDSGVCELETISKMIDGRFIYAHSSEEEAFLISEDGLFYVFDCTKQRLDYLTSIHSEISSRGNVSSIIRDGDDFIISFLLNGVIRLHYLSDEPQKYEVIPFDINCGVFSLLKDRYQDIIWIGTDGQGVLSYSRDNLTFFSYHYKNLPINLSKPIRALHLDRHRALWIGTKGEGIILAYEFCPGKELSSSDMKRLSLPGNLQSSAIYSFMEDSTGGMWIGSEEQGIFYCPAGSESVFGVQGSTPPDFKYIHDMVEDDDGTIWVATVGCGVFHLAIDYSEQLPRIASCERLDFGPTLTEKKYYFTLHKSSDGTLWFGNRGGGLVHYHPEDESFDILRFDTSENPLANDIWDIFEDSSHNIWLGTSDGIIKYDGEFITRPTDLHCIVHQIIGGHQGSLWFTTNTGLIRFDPTSESLVRYGYNYGLETIEFCDGASYYEPESGNILVGGVDGFVSVDESPDNCPPFHPSISLRRCVVDGNAVRLSSVLETGETIRIPRGKILNSITFYALDYLDGSNYNYQFKLDAKNSDEWIETAPEMNLNALKQGRHTISIRYLNTITGYISPSTSYKIVNPAPLHRSTFAGIMYSIIACCALSVAIVSKRRKQRMAALEISKQLDLRRKEEAASAQIRLLENIARQFSLPLSMISIPASQLIDYRNSDDKIRRLSGSILNQSNKMGSLLRMMQEFGESGKEQQPAPVAKLFQTQELISRIVDSNETDSRNRQITILFECNGTDIWSNSPKDVATIVDISLSVSINHSNPGTNLKFKVETDSNCLSIETCGSGEWLGQEDSSVLFDKISAMNYFLKKSYTGDSFQDEMRLALCANTVSRLGGNITYNEEGGIFRILIKLPKMEPDSSEEYTDIYDFESEPYIKDRSRKTMLIIGNSNDLGPGIAGYFRNDYHIHLISEAGEYFSDNKKPVPDIVIFENTTYTATPVDAIRKMKLDKRTAHVPVILISPMGYNEDEDAPWDVKLTLPLDFRNLRKVVCQNIKRLNSLKDYYSSAVSVYEFVGNNVLHQEDKAFLETMFSFIADNISNPALNTEMIASGMGMSVRNLYHKLDGLIVSTPRNVILDYRLAYSEQLLIRTKLTIEEIIDRSGFANRGTFFRNFASKYGMTPRAFRNERTKEVKETMKTLDGHSRTESIK